MLLFVLYVILTLEYVEKIVWSDHSNETSLLVLSHGTILFFSILQNEINKGMKVLTIERLIDSFSPVWANNLYAITPSSEAFACQPE